jgi:hypothetical protein
MWMKFLQSQEIGSDGFFGGWCQGVFPSANFVSRKTTKKNQLDDTGILAAKSAFDSGQMEF